MHTDVHRWLYRAYLCLSVSIRVYPWLYHFSDGSGMTRPLLLIFQAEGHLNNHLVAVEEKSTANKQHRLIV